MSPNVFLFFEKVSTSVKKININRKAKECLNKSHPPATISYRRGRSDVHWLDITLFTSIELGVLRRIESKLKRDFHCPPLREILLEFHLRLHRFFEKRVLLCRCLSVLIGEFQNGIQHFVVVPCYFNTLLDELLCGFDGVIILLTEKLHGSCRAA